MEFTFATRRYFDDGYLCISRMVRRGRQFFLIEEPSRPGEEIREIRYTLRRVFEWLQMMPETIERAVIESPWPHG